MITTMNVLVDPFAIIASGDAPQSYRRSSFAVCLLHCWFGRGSSHRIPVTTSTSLNLRALLKTALVRSGMDSPATEVSGLTAAAKALFVAGAAQTMPHSVVLYIVPSDADIEQAVGDVRFFASALEGLSEGAVQRSVLPFPSHAVDPYRGMAPHVGVSSARALSLHATASGSARVIVASAASLLPRISRPDRLLSASVDLRPGQDIAPTDLVELLVDAGFNREDPADRHGEFAMRGGIVDVFPAGASQPVRLEFVGDTIESLRRYDPATQRSVQSIDQITIVPLRDVLGDDRESTLLDYLAGVSQSRVIVSERDEVQANGTKLEAQLRHGYEEALRRAEPGATILNPSQLFADWASLDSRLARATNLSQLGTHEQPGTGDQPPATDDQPPATSDQSPATSDQSPAHIRCQPAIQLHGRVGDWVAEIRKLREQQEIALFVAVTPGRAERTIELLKEYDLFAVPVERAEDAQYATVLVAIGGLSRGFRLPDAALQIYAEYDVFEEERRAPERRRSVSKAFLSDLRDLKPGDFVVHIDHGIGAFAGLKQIGIGDATQEFLELRYAGDDKLFVPVERLDLMQKYTGASRPPIDRLGGSSWERAKSKVKKAMRDMAEELLKLYAARKAVPGHAFSPDSHWQQEFEDAFEYELTPDQHSAIAEIKRDMQSPGPMDRLLCGDVGYGKTEVAMRAAFKAVMDGKQVAFLAPTTVLAFQHQKTLTERFAGFPVRVEMVSRFKSKAEQREILVDLAGGKVDIIVGTHRLLSKDVEFRDLGLLVVDEEQRFGVAHKEKIKQLRKKVDVLTMSATPIPRTLNMSLVGIRDMSIIETPPKDRLSIQTNVVRFDQQIISRAIRNELARSGQVYVVHNRVESIFSIGNLIQRLVPEARVVIGHGQMSEEVLERAMLDFIARKYDVLLATTIVENGLDISNANTIIINRADRYGLSQLYQLRGRVGRSDRPAYAYLLIPPEDNLSPVAKKRLAAIKEFSDLGSGFRVAALDLEIRGAGNLLGGEQSGHIETVGFELYMKLLEQTVRELKGEEVEPDVRATVNLGVDLRIADSYVPDMNQRLMLYRKVAAARSDEEIDSILEEAADRYGPPPDSILNLADYGRLRVRADQLGIESIDRDAQAIVLKFRPQAKVDPMRLVALVRQRSDLTLVPPAALRLNLDGIAEVGPATRPRSDRSAAASSPSAVSNPKQRGSREQGGSPSWWTARAREREVRPGFSKAEILRPARRDPRTPGGLFDRVGALLSDLLDRM
jgi:transcription-repair coupling factor (superfamily II helicase)